MPVFKQPKPIKFTPQTPVEMHFHDHDETWVVMGGRARAHAVGRDGKREEFVLEAGIITSIRKATCRR
jgi:mannose-6-phosphate isomerase-like protein (cupin superfamily)